MEFAELENFERVKENLCLIIVFPKKSNLYVLKTPEDLKAALSTLLQRREEGEYPFITIPLANIAYGRIKKERSPTARPSASSSAPSSKRSPKPSSSSAGTP